MEGAIPLWVEGRLVCVTGLTKRSTCEDVIESVIHSKWFQLRKLSDPDRYKVVEQWKRMERHLPRRCKILRVWHAWGEERKNVHFLLRKRKRRHSNHSSNSQSRLGFGSSVSNMHRTKIRYLGPRMVRVKKSLCDKDAGKLRDIVIAQKQILSHQQQKLADKDNEIDQYETTIHLNRVAKVGENYLQDTYLGNDVDEGDDENGDSDSTSKLIPQSSTNWAVHEATELYERILEISHRIAKQEEFIRVLSAQIRHSISLKEPFIDDFNLNSTTVPQLNIENFDAYMYKTKIRIECLSALNKSQKLAIDHNERTMEEYNRIFQHKLNYMQQLEIDLAEVDIETKNIHHSCNLSSSSYTGGTNERRAFLVTNIDGVFIDNNSDTGLSSLHSSSDDGGYMLDTLV